MNRIILPFTITFLAGISTILGVIPTFFKKKYENVIINFSLSFSVGVMATISFVSLIPEAINYLANKNFVIYLIVVIFVVLGIITSMLIDDNIEKIIPNNKLYKLGIVSIIALMLHNIPEGITTFITTSTNLKLGLTMSLAIALHNIPEGIAIAVPIYYSTKSRLKAFVYTIISGFSEFFGSILAYLLLARYVNNHFLAFILALTAGIMIHISFYELLPNARDYHNQKITLLGIILGIITMLLCHHLLTI